MRCLQIASFTEHNRTTIVADENALEAAADIPEESRRTVAEAHVGRRTEQTSGIIGHISRESALNRDGV